MSFAEHLVAEFGDIVVHGERRAEEIVYYVSNEIGIFVIRQHGKVDRHRKDHKGTSFTSICQDSEEIVEHYYRHQEYQEETAGLEVKEKAGEEQERVTQEDTVFQQGETGEDQGEKGPEIELRKQERMSLVKRQEIMDVSEQNFSHRLASLYFI